MDKSQLRIGNIVNHRKKPRRIYKSHFHGCLINFSEPIRINDEVIEKSGLELVYDYTFTNIKLESRGFCIRYLEDLNGYYFEPIQFPTARIGVEFLHELQNLYYLTLKEELIFDMS